MSRLLHLLVVLGLVLSMLPIGTIQAAPAPYTTSFAANISPALAAPIVSENAASLTDPAFFVSPDSQPLLGEDLEDSPPLQGIPEQFQPPPGLYRAQIFIRGAADVDRLQAMGFKVLTAAEETAVVLVKRNKIDELGRLGMFPQGLVRVADMRSPTGAGLTESAAVAEILNAVAADADNDGLTDTEETWWCTGPSDNNSDSPNAPSASDPNDGAEVQALIQALRANRLTQYSAPFTLWPSFSPFNPAGTCLDGDQDAVPDLAEAVLGLKTDTKGESTDRDRFDDGQEVFGTTFCPGSAGACGYGGLPRNEDGSVFFKDLPNWVLAPGSSPYVAAFPIPEVSVVPGSWKVERITTITTSEGAMAQTTKEYGSSVTKGQSTSIADTVTWNNWEEVSESVETPLTGNTLSVSEVSPESNPWRVTWGGVKLVGGAAVIGLGCLGGLATGPGVLATCAAGVIGGGITMGDGVVDIVEGLKSDDVQPQQVYNIQNSANASATASAQASATVNNNIDFQGVVNSLDGVQYAINQQGTLLARGLHDISYAISQPRFTETRTNGHSWGGAQTITNEQYEEHTLSESEAFTTGQNWSTAWAVDSSKAARLDFSYTVKNTGTDYTRELVGLIFNVYLGDDETPIVSYPAWQLFPNGKLQNIFPFASTGEIHNYSTNTGTTSIYLTLEQMKRIDLGERLSIVVANYDFGVDKTFHQDAVDGGVTVYMEDGVDDGNELVDMYVLPTWGADKVQDVLFRYFPAGMDGEGNVNSLRTPEFNGSNPPTFNEHFLSDIAWWNIYQTCDTQSATDCANVGATALKDQTARPNSAILIRMNRDSDRDGYKDSVEVKYGTDKNDPASHPQPEVLAGYVKEVNGNNVTVKLVLENTGTFDAYGIDAVMYAPDNTTTISNNTVGGNGRVGSGGRAVVGSLIKQPVWVNQGSNTAKPYATGQYSGTADRTYTFSVSTPGVIGQGSTAMSWNDGAGGQGTLQLGSSYHAPLPINVANGLQIGFDTGSIGNGTSFTVQALTPRDTFQYTINNANYAEPVILVSFSDPQGSHRFITPILLNDLTTPLAPTYANAMLKNTSLDIVATDAFNPSGNNTTNLVLNSPHPKTIQGGKLYLNFVSDGKVVKEIPYTLNVETGVTVYPTTWAPSSFSADYHPNGDNILIAFWTDAQGNIIDSAARPFNTFANDPDPEFNFGLGNEMARRESALVWNIGTVNQGEIVEQSFTLANTGGAVLKVGVNNPDLTLTVSGVNGIVGVAPSGSFNVNLSLDTSSLSGAVNKTLTFRTNDTLNPLNTINIQGTVGSSGTAAAFNVKNRPLHQRVRIYGTLAQYSTVDFTHIIPTDAASAEPCFIYDGQTLKGVGKYCADFGGATTSVGLFGDGRDGVMPSSGNLDNDNGVGVGTANGTQGATTISINDQQKVWRINLGDVVLIHQSRGNGAGNWELNKAATDCAGFCTLSLEKPLKFSYVTNGGNEVAQIQRVPQYTDCTVTGTMTPLTEWNGTHGGIFAVMCNGTMTITGSISVNGTDGPTCSGAYCQTSIANGGGFRGGRALNTGGSPGYQGEGTSGGGTTSKSANGNGGGGAGSPVSNGSSGGGGGHANAGQNGQRSDFGNGGGSAGAADLINMVFGGAGGGGTEDSGSNKIVGAGGNGGGVIFIAAKTANLNGAVTSNGGKGGDSNQDGGGGGGAGGSILLQAQTINLGTNAVTARAGQGGNGPSYQGGGNGSVGRIRIEYCNSISGTTNPAASTQKLNCYLAEKTTNTNVHFTIPDAVSGSANYTIRFGQRYDFGSGGGNKTRSIHHVAQPYATATLDALVTNLGAGGATTLTIDVCNNGSSEFTYSATLTHPTTLSMPNFASALNACIASLTPTEGKVDVPIKVAINRQADVMLTNLITTPGAAIDLVMTTNDLTIGNNNSTEGSTIQLTGTARNNGSKTANSVVVGFYAGDPNNGGTLLGSEFINTLAVNDAKARTFDWVTTGYTGTHTIYAVVDPQKTITETIEINNTVSKTVTIKTRADLTGSGITPNSQNNVLGEVFQANVALTNAGQTNAPASVTKFEWRGAFGDSGTQNFNTGAINANSPLNLQIPYTPTKYGLHTYTATLDINNVVNEFDEANNVVTDTVYVGLPATLIDAGCTAAACGSQRDLGYNAAQGYGFLNGSTYTFANSVNKTVRFDGAGNLQYRFSGLQPGRDYHLDAIFYQEGENFSQTVAFDGVDSGKTIPLNSGVESAASILIPKAAYSTDREVVVSIKRAGNQAAFVSWLALRPIQYTYLDSGAANEPNYSAGLGYGPLNGEKGGSGSAVDTYRFTFGSTPVQYQFDNLSPSKKYQINVTLYDSASSAKQERVDADGVTICNAVQLNAVRHLTCELPASTYADGKVVIDIVCANCSGAKVNEIALEEKTLEGTTPPPLCYTLTTTAAPGGTGTVGRNPSPTCNNNTQYPEGTLVTLTANPNGGYYFANWSGDGSGATNPIVVTMNANKSVTANFTQTPTCYTLTTNMNPGGSGSVNANPAPNCNSNTQYSSGTQVTLTATANGGYTFANWSGDGSGTTNPIVVTLSANKNVTANFTQTPTCYTLTTNVNPSGGGVVNVNPAPNCNSNTQYSSGTQVTLTANANGGYTFANWSGDASGATNPTNFTMNGNKSATANFSTPGCTTAPKLVAPPNKATILTLKRKLDWEDEPCATRYEIQVRKNNKKGPFFAEKSVNKSKFKAKQLEKGITYLWRARACKDTQCGSWSKWRKFTVSPTAAWNLLPLRSGLGLAAAWLLSPPPAVIARTY